MKENRRGRAIAGRFEEKFLGISAYFSSLPTILRFFVFSYGGYLRAIVRDVRVIVFYAIPLIFCSLCRLFCKEKEAAGDRCRSEATRGRNSARHLTRHVLISVSGEWQTASTVSVMPNRWSMCVSVDRQFIGCGESDAAPGE